MPRSRRFRPSCAMIVAAGVVISCLMVSVKHTGTTRSEHTMEEKQSPLVDLTGEVYSNLDGQGILRALGCRLGPRRGEHIVWPRGRRPSAAAIMLTRDAVAFCFLRDTFSPLITHHTRSVNLTDAPRYRRIPSRYRTAIFMPSGLCFVIAQLFAGLSLSSMIKLGKKSAVCPWLSSHPHSIHKAEILRNSATG